MKGLYPPEACPGEVDQLFPITADRDDTAIQDWWDRQSNDNANPHIITDNYHADPAPDPQDGTDPQYSSKIHQEAGFSSRVCGGTKTNFVLVNDPYRTPYEWWTSVNAELLPMVEGENQTDFGSGWVKCTPRRSWQFLEQGGSVDVVQFLARQAEHGYNF